MTTRYRAVPPKSIGSQSMSLRETLFSSELVAFDCDGVLWKGGKAIEGAAAVVEELRQKGKSVVFVTNNSTSTREQYVAKLAREQYVAKLARFGLGTHPVSSIYSVAWYTAQYLVNDLGARPGIDKVFVLGSAALADEVRLAGLDVIEPDSDMPYTEVVGMPVDPAVRYVVVGMDRDISYSRYVVVGMDRDISYS
ncbi:HAD-superfamily hydrolase, subfamily IIA, partial [Kipferlia bialata]|eukprot:g11425.t1